MPIANVSIAEGRADSEIRALITGVSDAISHALSAPKASVRVIVTEVPLTHWASGDQTLDERRRASDSESASP